MQKQTWLCGITPVLIATFLASSPQAAAGGMQDRVDRFLDLVNAAYQAVSTVEAEAQWDAATKPFLAWSEKENADRRIGGE
jgi:hypothetical protein